MFFAGVCSLGGDFRRSRWSIWVGWGRRRILGGWRRILFGWCLILGLGFGSLVVFGFGGVGCWRVGVGYSRGIGGSWGCLDCLRMRNGCFGRWVGCHVRDFGF